jgi:hypothetical protein
MLIGTMMFMLRLSFGHFLQVIGHLSASRDEQVGQGFLDRVEAWAAGEEDAVGGAVDLLRMHISKSSLKRGV